MGLKCGLTSLVHASTPLARKYKWTKSLPPFETGNDTKGDSQDKTKQNKQNLERGHSQNPQYKPITGHLLKPDFGLQKL